MHGNLYSGSIGGIYMFWRNLEAYVTHCFDFKGKITRSQFWHPFVVVILFQLLLACLVMTRYYLIVTGICLIPTFSLTVRRLRDASLSPKWLIMLYLLRLPFEAGVIYFSLFNDHSLFDYTVIFGFWLISYIPFALVGRLSSKDKLTHRVADKYLTFASILMGVNLLGLAGLGAIYALQDKKLPSWYYYTIVTFLFVSLILLSIYILTKYSKLFATDDLGKKLKICLKTTIWLNLAVYMVSWVFYGSAIVRRINEINSISHSQVVATVQKNLNRDYHKAGFAGTVVVNSKGIKHDSIKCNDNYVVPYTYKEKIGKQTYKINGYVFADPVSLKYDPFINKEFETYNFRGDSIGYDAVTGKAPYFQPDVQKKFKEIDEQFKKKLIKADEQTVKPLYGGLVVQKDTRAFKALTKTVKENRKEHKPVNGFYNLDIKLLAKKGTIEFYSTFHQSHKWTPEQYLKIEHSLKKLRSKRLYDGKYNIYFEHGKASSPDSKIITFTIKKGKLQNTFLKTIV